MFMPIYCVQLIFAILFLTGQHSTCAMQDQIEPRENTYSYQNFYEELKKETLKSVVDALPQVPDNAQNSSFARQEFNAKIFLSSSQRLKLAFDVALKYAERNPAVQPTTIIDTQSWKDLEVVCGSGSHPECSLASVIDYTSSELGKVLLYEQLLQPTSDIAKLKNKQQIVALLLEHQDVFDELNRLFTDFFKDQRYENNILSFWADNDLFASYVEYPEFSTERFQAIARWLQTNEINTQIQEGSDIISYSIVNRINGVVRSSAEYALGNYRNSPLFRDLWIVLPRITQTILTTVQNARETNYTLAVRLAITGVITAALSSSLGQRGRFAAPLISIIVGYTVGKIIEMSMMLIESLMDDNMNAGIRAVADLNFCMYQRLLLFAQYIKFMQQVAACIDKAPKLKNLLPSLKALTLRNQECSLFSYFAQEFTGPNTFDHFINRLYSIGDDDNSWQSNYIGRVLATYRAIELHKENLLPSIMALADLDRYLSLVRFFKKNKDCGNPISYSHFVDINNCCNPSLELINFWSPTITQNPITNSLNLGIDKKPQNALITGPNTGGKSTTMRGIAFVILLGLSTGIVPAEHARFTPFSTIRAYLNITDDASQGLSLFKSSVNRASDLIKDAQQESGFSLILFDELFNGTNPQGGEALAYATLKEFGSSPDFNRTVCIASTHFPCVDELAQDSTVKFALYQVADPHDENNRFKLLPGRYTTFNGFDVAQESGLPHTILTSAQRYYEHKFVQNPELEMLLKMLAYDISILRNVIIKDDIQKFVALIFIAPYSERFFNLAQEKNLNLITLLSEIEDQGHFMLRYAAELNITDKQLLTKLIAFGAQDPDKYFSEYFVNNQVKSIELIDDKDVLPSYNDILSDDEDKAETLRDQFGAFNINEPHYEKSKKSKLFKLAYVIRGNRAYKDYTDDECSFGPEVSSITQITIANNTIAVRSKDKMEQQFRKNDGCFLGTFEKCENIAASKHQKNKQQKTLEVSSDRFLVKLKDDNLYTVALYSKESEHLFDLKSVYPHDKPTLIAVDDNTIVVGRESGIVEVHQSTEQAICSAAIAGSFI